MNPIDEFLEDVDTFTTGTIGRPGQRTFFLQVRADGQFFSVKCEKLQVAAIARFLTGVLQDLPPAEDRPVPAAMTLVPPGSPAFVLGGIALGYDQRADRLVLELTELGDQDEDDDLEDADDDLGRLRISITRGQALAFCELAEASVAAGRPLCQWCNLPIDPDGHPCPRMN